jgi:hypothetical protein
MKLPRSVCEVLREHVVLEGECIDRMCLNVYVPQWQRVGGVVGYLRGHLGRRFASTAAAAPKTKAFVDNIERFVADQGLEMAAFGKNQRKDDVTQQYLQHFDAEEGVLYFGCAQEKARVVRTERRRNALTGATYPWVVHGSAMVNRYDFYCVDEDFGPFFLKFCPYFPYNAKLCINGNEYAKCQLRKRGIAFEALDNGVLSCAEPEALQRICDGLDEKRPRQVEGQRAAALRFGDANVRALLDAVLRFVFVARGFTNKDLRQQFAALLGKRAEEVSPGRMSYELRRLRLHGLIERLPKTHRYRPTGKGLRTALFHTRVYAKTDCGQEDQVART